jgi:hypothetical protein
MRTPGGEPHSWSLGQVSIRWQLVELFSAESVACVLYGVRQPRKGTAQAKAQVRCPPHLRARSLYWLRAKDSDLTLGVHTAC